MAALAEQFKKALTNIEPDAADGSNAAEAHAAISKVLRADAKLKDWGIDPILIGSYARQVSIKRVKDVDVFGRLSTLPGELNPGAVLDELGRVLFDAYGDRVEQQHRSFKVDFPESGLSVDAVPARVCGDHWELPSRPEARAKWVETDPIKLGKITTDMNQDSRFQLGDAGIYVPTVKLIRQVRSAQLGDSSPGGLFFEILTYWVFKNDMKTEGTRAAYLAKTIRGIATLLGDVLENGLADPTLEEKTISTKADAEELQSAADMMSDAADLAEKALAEEDECVSAVMWSELLGSNDSGQVFELPAHCQSDGTKRSVATLTRTPGASRPPAGSDRYA